MNALNGIEIQVLNFVQEHLRCSFLDFLFPIITNLGVGPVWALLAIILLANKKTRKMGIAVVISILLQLILNLLILKPLFARIRPFTLNPEVQLLAIPPSDYSFPSGHTGLSFAAAGAVFKEYRKLRFFSLAFALLVGLSRIYLYMHYPTDVIAGMALGLLTGYLADNFVKSRLN